MSSPHQELPARRLGMRAVAQAAGVSLMTVSLALRNSPRVLLETRMRVQQVAAELGYRPDPEISRLMQRLRPTRAGSGAVLAMIDLHAEKINLQAYDLRVRDGIEGRARQLGYSVSLFALRDYGGRLPRLLGVVRCRGISGILLLPATPTVALDPTATWDGLSVVAVTTSVISPQFHQVVPHHVLNIRLLIEHLTGRGFKRLGLIMSESLHQRTYEIYAMVMTVAGHRSGILIIPDLASAEAREASVIAWLEARDPDVIIGGELMLRMLKAARVARACVGREKVALTDPPDATTLFLDQQPDVIGASAVSLLTGMIHNNETGIPASPQITVIRGRLPLVRNHRDETRRRRGGSLP